MKNLHLSLRGRLGFLGLAPFFLLSLVNIVWGSSFDVAAVSFLEESHLSISDEARSALLLCISNDRQATGWTVEVESDDTVYSMEVISIPRAQIRLAQKSNNNSAMRRSLSRATLRLAVYLDNGRLDRKRFSNYDAANYALLMSYRGRIKGGIQSFSRAIGYSAISLVWVRRTDIKTDYAIKAETQLSNYYCKYLYKTATDLFNSGKYDEALRALHQIHYMAWSDINAYLGAATCFLKMGQKDNAIQLTSNLVNTLSKDMTSDEMASAGSILFDAGEKDEGFNVLKLAYKMLKSANSKEVKR